jgi:Icc protein
MKLVHISDIHINAEPILGHDSIANFKKCLAHVEAHDHDADRVVITGDLTHYGREESYRELQRHPRSQLAQGQTRAEADDRQS